MPQKISPFVEGKYGWNYGESGWNSGMDENLTKFSFLFDRNIDAIVPTLPSSPVNGQAFFLTTDNRMYFRVESSWYSTPTPKWFEFQIRSTGVVYKFDGSSVSVVESPSSFGSRIDALEVTVSSLGTAAFEDVEYFASQANLDVTEANAANYTDELRQDLGVDGGAGRVGFSAGENYPGNTVGARLADLTLSSAMTLRVPSQYPSLQSAIDRASLISPLHQVRVEILIEAGHVLTSGFRIEDKDLSFVTISSEDGEVSITPSFSHVANNNTDLDQIVARTNKIGFLAIRSKMPVWNILVDMSACPTVYGYVLNAGSYGYIRSNKGVKNTSDASLTAGTNIIVAGNSTLDGMRLIATGGLISGITVTHRSNANIAEINVSGSTGIGLDVSRGSTVYANLADASGRAYGIDVRRSFVAAQGAVLANCTQASMRASIGAKLIAVDAVMTGAVPAFGFIQPEQGCDISVSGATVNGAAVSASHVYQAAGINKITGRGVVTSQAVRDAHPTFYKAGTATRQVYGAPSVASLTYATAFSRAEPGYFAGGVVYGDDVGFRLTCDGIVVIEDTNRNVGGSAKSVAFVPPFSFEASCMLEVYNRGASTAAVAYRLTEYR